nr:hypothetical protein CFP56_09097 [Quercus suber]
MGRQAEPTGSEGIGIDGKVPWRAWLDRVHTYTEDIDDRHEAEAPVPRLTDQVMSCLTADESAPCTRDWSTPSGRGSAALSASTAGTAGERAQHCTRSQPHPRSCVPR